MWYAARRATGMFDEYGHTDFDQICDTDWLYRGLLAVYSSRGGNEPVPDECAYNTVLDSRIHLDIC